MSDCDCRDLVWSLESDLRSLRYLLDSLVSDIHSDIESSKEDSRQKFDFEISMLRNNQNILIFPELQSISPIEGSFLSILLFLTKAAMNKDYPFYSKRAAYSYQHGNSDHRYPIDLRGLLDLYLDDQVFFDICSEFRRSDIKSIWESLFKDSLFEPWMFNTFTGCGEYTYYIKPISKEDMLRYYAKINKAAETASRNPILNVNRISDVLSFMESLTKPMEG